MVRMSGMKYVQSWKEEKKKKKKPLPILRLLNSDIIFGFFWQILTYNAKLEVIWSSSLRIMQL